jgi:methyl-accepting chemotaxis protein
MTFALRAKQESEEMTEEVARINAELARAMERSAVLTRGMEERVNEAVTALQFQDITTQLLANCRGRVEMVEQLLEAIESEFAGTPGRAPVQDVLADLVARTSALEARNPAAQKRMAGGDVDLF